MANPQKENGYTSIANEIIEQLLKAGLNGTELAVILYVIRKTYGYQKKQDQISLSQFLNAIPITKQTLCTALYKLQVVKILRLVKKGTPAGIANLWELNKNYDNWLVVKKTRVVKKTLKGSQVFHKKVVKKTRHTKETIQKKDTKERLSSNDDEEYNFEIQLEKMKTAKDKRMSIIAAYWKVKGVEYNNREQYNAALRRELRPSASLKGYDLDRVISTMKFLNKEADFKWTLETVHKYIDEDINQLKGQEPIIILKSGEKIYDVNKLTELERRQLVYYKNGKWYETN